MVALPIFLLTYFCRVLIYQVSNNESKWKLPSRHLERPNPCSKTSLVIKHVKTKPKTTYNLSGDSYKTNITF